MPPQQCELYVSLYPKDRERHWVGGMELKLKQEEAKWISRLRTVQVGINLENELHYFL